MIEKFSVGEIAITMNATHFIEHDGYPCLIIGPLEYTRCLDLNTMKYVWTHVYKIKVLDINEHLVSVRPWQLRKLGYPVQKKYRELAETIIGDNIMTKKKVTGSVIGGKRLHASKKEERNIKKKYPKLIIDTNTHYLLHKVNKAYINDRGYLSFEYEDGSGEIKLQGPFYWPNSAKPADEVLKKHGLEKPEDIKYLIAYHCGAFPNGSPAWLLKSEENIPDDFYEKVLSIH